MGSCQKWHDAQERSCFPLNMMSFYIQAGFVQTIMVVEFFLFPLRCGPFLILSALCALPGDSQSIITLEEFLAEDCRIFVFLPLVVQCG